MTAEAYFHAPSGAVRFWVEVDDHPVGASVGKEVLHYRFSAHSIDEDPLATYLAHVAELAAAVRRRVAGGSIEPVMIRDPDLRQPPR